MMKKKVLIASVLLSVCSMAMSAQAAMTISSAGETNLSKINTNEWTDLSCIQSPLGYIEQGLTIIGENDKAIRFTSNDISDTAAIINMVNSSHRGTGIYKSEGNVIFDGLDINLNGVDNIGNGIGYKAISNIRGDLIFKNNVNIGVYSNQATVENADKMLFQGEKLKISRVFEKVNTDGTIKNGGELYIDSNDVLISSVNQTSIKNGIVNDAIQNAGKFVLNGENKEGTYLIYGDVSESADAETIINLNAGSSGNNMAILQGDIVESNDNFQLNITGANASWVLGEHFSTYAKGVNLKNRASIIVNINNLNPTNEWLTGYKTLSLDKFENDGTGVIQITTDLVHEVGDKVVFFSPATSVINIDIINKDDNNGVPISESDGHSVTIARVEGTTPIKLNTYLSFYNQKNSDENLQVMTPIIKEEAFNNMHDMLSGRDYNFIGWQSDDANGVLDKQLPSNEPYINTNELDNVFKRVMDIRNDPSEVGVWIRGETGKMKIEGYGYDYNLTSGGHDWKHESDAAIMFGGFGITHSINKCDTGIIGDTKSTGYNLYGSWLGKDNNDYIDVILKYGKMDKTYAGLDINNVFAAGSYSKDVLSIAAKYGRRYEMRNDWYYEPFAGLTWGKISDVDFKDARGFNIHGDSVTSKIANLGMQVGKKMDKRDFYYRMNLVHDFDGKMHVNVPGTTTNAYTDMGGTWLKCAIGTSAKLGKNNSYYIDLEKDFGSKVEKPWSISAGYRHTW